MHSRILRTQALGVLLLGISILPVRASPWAEVGDNQLRSDVELLQAAGVVRQITIQWPMPWESLFEELPRADLSSQPAAIQAAVQRLEARAYADTAPVTSSASLDFTNKPALVYGFDGLGRGEGQGQLSLESNGGILSGRVALGAISQDFGGKPNKLMPDGTYLSLRLGGIRFTAGYLEHWWGPGEISTLELSNNARPMPQIGFMRSGTQASSWPILRWLGPWQFEFFIAKFDGPQIQSGVYYDATRLTINPLPGLEIAAAKTEQICGAGHFCSPVNDYFTNFDFSTHPNNVNGEGSFDVKYSNKIGLVPFQVYAQMMDEDYSLFTSSGSSYLAGASIFLPTEGNPVKLTVEYTDTVATKTPFDFSRNIFGYTYTDTQFPDGMHYRGRTLGFSLDTDSTLMSLQGSWTDAAGRFYELALHHATIGSKHAPGVSVVSTAPVIVNLAEARVSLPLKLGERSLHLDLEGRLQDDQPRPSKGFAAAIEVALRAPL
ncbi:MAG TPA: capsule assembly Wzi family protein [Rhizomicrobium sp.]|nr:capsule assembly Wzi family protein [Rhizomicrobium sp.]